jgi:hypothetical protein
MKREALDAAWTEFNRARDSIEALANLYPKTEVEAEQIQAKWASYLSHADRMFNKLKAGRRSSPKTNEWYEAKIRQRNNDPLLCYLQHARNADEHSLEIVTENRPGFIRELPRTAAEVMTGRVTVEITEPHVRLMPVTDRRGGTRYDPPPNCIKPYNTGMLGLSRLEPILHEAEALVM